MEVRENVFEQELTIATINEKWVTIIPISIQFKMTCAIWSHYKISTRKNCRLSIIGRTMTVNFVLDTLENAVQAQQSAFGLILHTDLGK